MLELRPLAEVGKDPAVGALLASRRRTGGLCRRRPTDLDAFRGLRELRDEGELEAAICVGVVSPEAPPELAAESDLTVDGPTGWLAILEGLAE